MGLQFFRKEFALLIRIQGAALLVFAVLSGVLLCAGLGGMHPLRLLWLVGGACLVVDAIVTSVVASRLEAARKTKDKGAA